MEVIIIDNIAVRVIDTDKVDVVSHKQDIELVGIHVHIDVSMINIGLRLILDTSIMEIVVDIDDIKADACGMVEDNNIPVDISILGKIDICGMYVIEDGCTNTDNCCFANCGEEFEGTCRSNGISTMQLKKKKTR